MDFDQQSRWCCNFTDDRTRLIIRAINICVGDEEAADPEIQRSNKLVYEGYSLRVVYPV